MDDFDFRRPDYDPVFLERAARLKRIREEPETIPALKAYYAEHPADFICDFLTTVDPRNVEVGLPAKVPFLLFPKQREFIEYLHRKWRAREDGLAEKSRDMGVSWLCVAFAVWMWTFHAETVIGFGSRKEEYVDDSADPKALLWKVRESIDSLPKEFRPRGYVRKVHAPFMKITNPENGAKIVGEAGDNIGRGARTSIYFKDEAAFYDRPDLIDAALASTSNCKIDVSTPNGAGNPFYRKRHGGKLEIFTFHWTDDPRKDQKWYDTQVQMLDPVIVAQEIDINYEASVSDAFISGDLVTEAMKLGPKDVEAFGAIVWGLDVARFGDDVSVLMQRHGRVATLVEKWEKVDTQWLAQEVWQRALDATPRPNQIAVDDIGVGGGVTDRLRELARGKNGHGIMIEAVNSAMKVKDGRNYNLRTKMWDDMKEWLKDTPVSLPNDRQLSSELTSLKYKYQGGVRLLESKQEAKKRGVKSPDYADALALTFGRPIVTAHTKLSSVTQFTRGGFFGLGRKHMTLEGAAW